MKTLINQFLVFIFVTHISIANSHTPPDELPDLEKFSETVQDWELFSTLYNDKELEVIDMHLHPGSFDKLGPKGKEFVKAVFPLDLPDALKIPLIRFYTSFQLDPYGAFIGIKNECRRAGVSHCFLYATYAPETWGIEPNEDLIGYLDDARNKVNDKTFFYGLASINVANWEQDKLVNLANLESALSNPNVVGIKLAFAHTLTPFDDPQYFDIYELASRTNKPIYHHVGTSPLRRVSEFDDDQLPFVLRTFDPIFLEDAIKKFPKVDFILGHAGNDANREGYSKIDEVFELAKNYSNVYIEISALGSKRSDPTGKKMDDIFRRAKDNDLIDRIIYGSDGPGNPGNTEDYKKNIIESLQRVEYDFSEAQKVMAGNAREVYRLPE